MRLSCIARRRGVFLWTLLMSLWPGLVTAQDDPAAPLPPVVAEVIVRDDLEDVWLDWTTSEGLSAVMGTLAHVDPDLKPRGLYEVLFLPDAPEGERGAEKGAILAVEPKKMISFTWKQPPYMPIGENYTFVQLFFEPVGENETRLRLYNWGWGTSPDWKKARAYFAQSWPAVLDMYQKQKAAQAE